MRKYIRFKFTEDSIKKEIENNYKLKITYVLLYDQYNQFLHYRLKDNNENWYNLVFASDLIYNDVALLESSIQLFDYINKTMPYPLEIVPTLSGQYFVEFSFLNARHCYILQKQIKNGIKTQYNINSEISEKIGKGLAIFHNTTFGFSDHLPNNASIQNSINLITNYFPNEGDLLEKVELLYNQANEKIGKRKQIDPEFGIIHGEYVVGNFFLQNELTYPINVDQTHKGWRMFDLCLTEVNLKGHGEDIIKLFYKGYNTVRKISNWENETHDTFYSFALIHSLARIIYLRDQLPSFCLKNPNKLIKEIKDYEIKN